MKRATREWLEMNGKKGPIYDSDLIAVCKDITRWHEAMLNMLQHIEWHEGTCPPQSCEALRLLANGRLPKRGLK